MTVLHAHYDWACKDWVLSIQLPTVGHPVIRHASRLGRLYPGGKPALRGEIARIAKLDRRVDNAVNRSQRESHATASTGPSPANAGQADGAQH